MPHNEPQLHSHPKAQVTPGGEKRPVPWKTVTIFVILGLTVGFIVFKRSREASGGPGSQKGVAGRAGGGFPTPVLMATVEKKDIPIYLDGIGTVQAFNTVSVRSRVEGQLQKLAFGEGTDVKAGDLVAQIDPEPFKAQLAQAQAKRAQDAALLENARIDLKRNSDLLQSKIVSQQVFDAQQSIVAQYEAAVRADDAAIRTTQIQLDYTTITAPISGRTGIRQADAGNIIRPGDTNGLVVITQLKPISVIFTLPEQNLGDIHAAAGSELEVLAMDRDGATILARGTLTVIDNQIDSTTGTIRMKATFGNEDARLWPGQFVNTRLLVKTRKDALVVASSAIQRGPQGAYVYVVDGEMKAQMRAVTPGPIEHDLAIIEKGLQPGERVVVDGQFKLRPGGVVKPASASGGTNDPVKGSGNHGATGDKKRKSPKAE